jgi:hypothetical protein
MVKRKEFIAKIIINLVLDLFKILPEEETLDDMNDKFRDYLKQKYFE